MRRSVVLIMLASASPALAEDADSPVATSSRWDLTVAAGASTTSSPMPGMQLMGTQARAESDMTTASTFEPSGLFALRYRIRDRIVWSIPTLSFAYLGGTPGERELIPWAGLTSWGAGYSSIEHLVVQGDIGAGAGLREWLAPDVALNATADITSQFRYASTSPACEPTAMCPSTTIGPDTWRASITAGASLRAGNTFTFNLAVGASQRLLVDGALAGDSAQRGTSLSIGSLQTLGLRTLPLVEARLDRRWSIDGYAAAAYNLGLKQTEQTYLLGVTRRWPD